MNTFETRQTRCKAESDSADGSGGGLALPAPAAVAQVPDVDAADPSVGHVGSQDDPAEREADLVADWVLGARSGRPPRIALPSRRAALRLKCAACGALAAPERLPGLASQPARDPHSQAWAERARRRPEGQQPIRRQPDTGGEESADALPDAVLALATGGRPLDPSTRAFFEGRLGIDLSGVRVHTEAAAAHAARGLHAQAYTHGSDIAFAEGRFQPATAAGRHLIAHELTHVMQQTAAGAGAGLIQRQPETWYRGEAEGVAPAQPGSVVHDFGDGLYLTDDPGVAARYADLRAGKNPATGRVVAAILERSELGNILDLGADPRWAALMAEQTPGGVTHEALIRMANENYWRFFHDFLRRYGLALEHFDAIIGPEYLRGGTQVCIRNPTIAARVRGMLGAPRATAAPAEAPAEYPVQSRFRVLGTEEIPGGRVVSEVEVVLGDGLEAINARIAANGARPLPGRFVLRITTDANGGLVAAEASASEAAALAETLARQALLTAPRGGGGAAAASGTAGAARAVSPWVRGASWAGLALFAAVTVYRYQSASPENRPRVLTQAGGGLAAGAVGGYLVCNLVLGIETLGWSLLICGALVGVPAGMAGEAIADVAYDEATIDDNEIRAWVQSHELPEIERLPAVEKLRLIFSLMRGWIGGGDAAAIQRILASVGTAAEMARLRRVIEPHITEMTDIGQRTQVRVALARLR